MSERSEIRARIGFAGGTQLRSIDAIRSDLTWAVGAGFALLDFNQIIKKIDGRLFPFG